MKKTFKILFAICCITLLLTACGNKCEHVYNDDCDAVCNNCGEAREVTAHVYDDDCDAVCNNCGEAREVTPHVYDDDCDAVCNNCGEERDVAAHVYDDDCDAVCNNCGEERDVVAHIYSGDCDAVCNNCGIVREAAAHVYSGDCDAVCDNCEEEREALSEHNWAIDDLPRCVTCGHIKTPKEVFTVEYGDIGAYPLFTYSGNIDELEFISSDERVFQVLSKSVSQIGYANVTFRTFDVGEATLIVKAADGGFVETFTVRVEKEKPVYIGQGELCESITLDKTEAEVYKDDTTVTYTVTTSNDVDKIELIQLELNYNQRYFKDLIQYRYRENYVNEIYKLEIDDTKLVDSLTLDESNGRYYAASKSIEGDKTVWTIKWDLGDTAVRFVQVNTIDSDTNTRQENYVRLNIEYPLIDASLGLEEVIKRWVELNLDKAFLYEIDTRTMTDEQMEIYLSRTPKSIYADEEFALLGFRQKRGDLDAFYKIDDIDNQTLYDKRFDASAIYRSNFVSSLNSYAMVVNFASTEGAEDFFSDIIDMDRILVNNNYEARTHMFYYTITDEIRAVIAYENGYEIDAEKFPYAHSILERASAVLDEIITDGMTDFEKEKAIYTWMYEQGLKELTPTPEDVDEYKVVKTAYGLLNNYGGDCMGWSGTFFTLCNMAGVECSTVSVKTIEPGQTGGPADNFMADHRINLVRLDGEYYFVEAFWSWQKADPSDGTYRYMNMTSDVASESYIWMNEEGFGPVTCNYETYLVDDQTGELLNK